MTLTPPTWSARVPRPLVAAVTGALLAVVTVAAQSGIFNEVYEGELFGVQQELATPGYAAGVAYLNDTLYVADGENGNLIVRDADSPLGRSRVLKDQGKVMLDLIPNQLAIVDVVVTTDGTAGPVQKAILVSDSSVNRVLAFDLGGNRLFTMQLDWPGVSEQYPPSDTGESNVQVINGMAMAPGSRFVLSTTADGPTSLAVVGTFAAGWAVDFGQDLPGALLVYRDESAQYVALDDDFPLTPDQALTDGGKTNEAFGVAFDSFGNLYLADSFRYTITAYGLNRKRVFQRLFTYGTPLVGGEVEQFYEPYGLAFWPDASDPAGGRLFVADAINNRIVAYRSNATALAPRPSALNPLFAIEIPDDTQPYAVAVDPPTGKVATSDASVDPVTGEDRRRVWVLQTRNLVAFNLQALDANGDPVESVCSGAPYSVRFSLTVPATRPPVTGATPILTVGGSLIDGINVGPVDLVALQTQTYTYSLTAPGSEAAPQVVELPILADATATSTTDVLPRTGTVSVRDCSGLPPTISAAPSIQPQLSGWTPVFASTGFGITLAAAATDDSGIAHIEYDLFGANEFGVSIPPVNNPTPGSPTQVTSVPLVEMGNTTIKFRALSTKNFPSTEDWLADPCTPDHCLAVWLVDVKHLAGSEGQVVAPFTVGPPQLSNLTYSAAGLPPGITFNPVTGEIGGELTYNAAGVHTVVMKESDGNPLHDTQWAFTWTVDNVNRVPVAKDDGLGATEDTAVTYAAAELLANDTDADGDVLTIAQVTSGTGGTATLNPDGTVTFVPTANSSGAATFTYTATDEVLPILASAPATVTVTVAAVNDAPSFTASNPMEVAEDAGPQTLVGWATFNPGAPNEGEQTATYTVSAVSNASLFGAGPFVATNGTLTYTPAVNAFGTSTFDVTVQDSGDGTNTSNTFSFTIKVTNVGDAPVAVADVLGATGNTTVTYAALVLLANDTDVDGDALTIAQVTSGTGGTATLNSDGTVTFVPTPNFSGAATFTYTAKDRVLFSNTVTVTIGNGPPECSATVTPALIWPPNHRKVYLSLAGITDPDGDALTIRFTGILQDEPTNTPGQGNTMQDGGIEDDGARAWVRAERTGGGDGRVYLVSFTATDPSGASCAGEVTVGVPHDQSGPAAVASPGRWNSLTGQLVSAPPAPVATDDAVTGPKGGQFKIALQAKHVAYGLPLTVSIAIKPSKGKATVNSDGTITYKAPSNWTGTTSFTYAVSNGVGGVDTAVVTVTVVNQSAGNDDDDDCGDRNHDHRNDRDRRDRDHRDGDHDRCRHS